MISALPQYGEFYHSPHIICLTGVDHITLKMDLFLTKYGYSRDGNLSQTSSDLISKIYLASANEVDFILNDWSYSIYHTDGMQETLIKSLKPHRYFIGFVEDIDDGFAYQYGENGQMIRSYSKLSITHNEFKEDCYGKPNEIENSIIHIEDPMEKIQAVAVSFGFNLKIDLAVLAIYKQKHERQKLSNAGALTNIKFRGDSE